MKGGPKLETKLNVVVVAETLRAGANGRTERNGRKYAWKRVLDKKTTSSEKIGPSSEEKKHLEYQWCRC